VAEVTLLIDGNNLLVRSIKAMERTPLSANEVPTGPLLVFVNMLSKYVRLVAPDAVVVCWDGGRSAHRLAIYPDYKSGRGHHDDSRDQHFVLAKEFLSLCNIHHVQVEGVEADDLIAAYCREIQGKKIILSGDKDFLQLLNDTTDQIRPTGKDELWDANRVLKETGCKPEHIPFVMALTGDGVPGVPKIGVKTACKLLAANDWSIPQLLQAEVPLLEGNRETVIRNLQLVDLRSPITWVVPVVAPPRFAPTDLSGILLAELLEFLARYRLAAIKTRLIAGSLWQEGRLEDG